MSGLVVFKFDGETYVEGKDEDFQRLLEAINDELSAKAFGDPELETDDERLEAQSQAFDGTSRDLGQWENLMGIMKFSPYELNVERVEVTLEDAVKVYFGEWFKELEGDDEMLNLVCEILKVVVPENHPTRYETMLELYGLGSDGNEILDSVDKILRDRIYCMSL